MECVLNAATAAPREAWGEPNASLARGRPVEFAALAGSPFDEPNNLRRVMAVYRAASRCEVAPAG
jgi:hypothetical protein